MAQEIYDGDRDADIVAEGDLVATVIVPYGAPGWFYVKISASSASVTNRFWQKRTVSKAPWSCQWYPFSEESTPNLYDATGALKKYDLAFGTNAREQEMRNWYVYGLYGHFIAMDTVKEADAERTWGLDFDNSDGDGNVWTGWDANVPVDFYHAALGAFRVQDGLANSNVDVSWFGHCDMAAAAIVLENEPFSSTVYNGVVFTPGDKKALLVALYHRFQFEYSEPRPLDGPELLPHRWHERLEKEILKNDRMFVADTYYSEIAAQNQVWNYPIYGMERIFYREKPNQNNERIVEVTCTAKCWTGTESFLYYKYNVTYDFFGIAAASTVSDWKVHEDAESTRERPDSAWRPEPQTSVSAVHWGGQLSYGNLRQLIPAP